MADQLKTGQGVEQEVVPEVPITEDQLEVYEALLDDPTLSEPQDTDPRTVAIHATQKLTKTLADLGISTDGVKDQDAIIAALATSTATNESEEITLGKRPSDPEVTTEVQRNIFSRLSNVFQLNRARSLEQDRNRQENIVKNIGSIVAEIYQRVGSLIDEIPFSAGERDTLLGMKWKLKLSATTLTGIALLTEALHVRLEESFDELQKKWFWLDRVGRRGILNRHAERKNGKVTDETLVSDAASHFEERFTSREVRESLKGRSVEEQMTFRIVSSLQFYAQPEIAHKMYLEDDLGSMVKVGFIFGGKSYFVDIALSEIPQTTDQKGVEQLQVLIQKILTIVTAIREQNPDLGESWQLPPSVQEVFRDAGYKGQPTLDTASKALLDADIRFQLDDYTASTAEEAQRVNQQQTQNPMNIVGGSWSKEVVTMMFGKDGQENPLLSSDLTRVSHTWWQGGDASQMHDSVLTKMGKIADFYAAVPPLESDTTVLQSVRGVTEAEMRSKVAEIADDERRAAWESALEHQELGPEHFLPHEWIHEKHISREAIDGFNARIGRIIKAGKEKLGSNFSCSFSDILGKAVMVAHGVDSLHTVIAREEQITERGKTYTQEVLDIVYDTVSPLLQEMWRISLQHLEISVAYAQAPSPSEEKDKLYKQMVQIVQRQQEVQTKVSEYLEQSQQVMKAKKNDAKAGNSTVSFMATLTGGPLTPKYIQRFITGLSAGVIGSKITYAITGRGGMLSVLLGREWSDARSQDDGSSAQNSLNGVRAFHTANSDAYRPDNGLKDVHLTQGQAMQSAGNHGLQETGFINAAGVYENTGALYSSRQTLDQIPPDIFTRAAGKIAQPGKIEMWIIDMQNEVLQYFRNTDSFSSTELTRRLVDKETQTGRKQFTPDQVARYMSAVDQEVKQYQASKADQVVQAIEWIVQQYEEVFSLPAALSEDTQARSSTSAPLPRSPAQTQPAVAA